MKAFCLVAMGLFLGCNASDKEHKETKEHKKVTINPHAPVTYVPDEHNGDYSSFHSPNVTPDYFHEKHNLWKRYNKRVSDTCSDKALSIVSTVGMSGAFGGSIMALQTDDISAQGAWVRFSAVFAAVTCCLSSCRLWRDCRKKPQEVANYSAAPTPRHGLPGSTGPSPDTQTRTIL